jgi:IS5 family transposase
MGNQRTLASMAWNGKGKITRRARFLAEMDAVIPWPQLVRLIEPHYPKAGNGRQPLGLEKMLRIYFLQQWFNLSDPQAEDAIYDSEGRCGALHGSSWARRWCRPRPRFCAFATCWSSMG